MKSNIMKKNINILIILLLGLASSSCLKEKYVQENFVDLGLPSGTLWAKCNLGATTPEGYGNYYAWGETTTKNDYSWDSYVHGNGAYELTKYCTDPGFGYNGFTDNLSILQPADDAATTTLGERFRIPTSAEWQELLDNTISEWTSVNNVNGLRFIAPNGNSIFLPAAGHYKGAVIESMGTYGIYWSSSLYESYQGSACDMYTYFDSRSYGVGKYYRFSGRPVRAVYSAK